MKIVLAVVGAVACSVGLLAFTAESVKHRVVSLDAVPFVQTSLFAPGKSVGLGAVVSETGQVITSYHLVRACGAIRVARNGGAVAGAETVAFDALNDLALLKTGLVGAEPAPFRAGAPGPGRETVYFAGMQGRHGALPARLPLYRARIAALYGPSRDVRMFTFISGWSSEDPTVQPGDSGGPVFDGAGNVLGIVAGQPDISTPATDSVLRRTAFALNAGLVTLFLAAHDVRTVAESAESRSDIPLAERAARSTVRIWCARQEQGSRPAS
jgi:S1-C subfamily serine protease